MAHVTLSRSRGSIRGALALATSSALAVALAVPVACSSSGGDPPASQGTEGQACYGNGTCNAGLACLSKVCVNAGVDSGTMGDGGVVTLDSGVDSGAADTGSTDSPIDAPPAWSPTALGAALSLWLDPNVGITNSNGRVVLWSDRSGQAPANNAAANPGAGPVVATRGGHVVLRWDTVTQSLTVPDATSLQFDADFALEMVVSSSGSDAGTGAGVIWHKGSCTVTTSIDLQFGTQNVLLNDPCRLLQPGVSTTTGFTDGNLHYVGVRRTSGQTVVRVDGVSTAPAAYPSGGAAGYDVTLGKGISGGFLGDIAEVVAVKGTLSATDLAKLEAYLKAKYGL